MDFVLKRPNIAVFAGPMYFALCQDTGICIAFVRVGMDTRFDATMSLEQMVNEGVRRAILIRCLIPESGKLLLSPNEAGSYRAAAELLHEACARNICPAAALLFTLAISILRASRFNYP